MFIVFIHLQYIQLLPVLFVLSVNIVPLMAYTIVLIQHLLPQILAYWSAQVQRPFGFYSSVSHYPLALYRISTIMKQIESSIWPVDPWFSYFLLKLYYIRHSIVGV